MEPSPPMCRSSSRPALSWSSILRPRRRSALMFRPNVSFRRLRTCRSVGSGELRAREPTSDAPPESQVFITSCRIRQHSHAHTEVVPGYPLARPTKLWSIDKGHAEGHCRELSGRRDDIELGEGARLFLRSRLHSHSASVLLAFLGLPRWVTCSRWCSCSPEPACPCSPSRC